MAELNSKEYAEKGGLYCPACKSEDIEGYGAFFDIGIAWQNCKCAACGAEWQDVYKLVGYNNLEED